MIYNSIKSLVITLFFSVITIGCGMLPVKKEEPQSRSLDDFYKRDLEVCFEGSCGEGVLVVPKKASYNFKIKSKGALDLFTFSTCHREETQEAVGGGWFGSDKKMDGTYIPMAGIETEYCPAYIGGYDKKGMHSWGFIDFETDEAKLPAVLMCNGDRVKSNGVSICQSKAGLIQEIRFEKPVTVEFDAAKCKLPKSEDGKIFRFEQPRGECVLAFFSAEGNVHRLTLLGYDKIMIRGE